MEGRRSVGAGQLQGKGEVAELRCGKLKWPSGVLLVAGEEARMFWSP